jgi:tetratricopeptide (TPR) repeat protein
LKKPIWALFRFKLRSIKSFFRSATPVLFLFVFAIENPHCGASNDHRVMARIYLKQGAYGHSLQEARRDIRLKPNELPSYLVAILAHLGRNEAEAAFDVLEEALDHGLDPRDESFYETLRFFAIESGRIDLAHQAFVGLLERHPDNDLIRSNLGWTYLQLGQENKALALFEAVADTNVLSFAKLNMSLIYTRQGELAAAARVLQEALEVDLINPKLWLQLGEVRLRQGDLESADGHFREAMNQHSDPALLAWKIGSAYYSRTLRPQAIKYWEQALEQGPPQASLLNNLAWAYAEEGTELDRALVLSLMAVKIAPESTIFLDTYAELFFLKGRYDRAIVVVERAIELETEEGGHYAYLLDQLSKFRQAQVDSTGSPL